MDTGLESHSAAIFVQSADANGKELLFVKLTDAALRGLEEAARHSRGQTGFVSFDGPANELQLPGGSSFALAISDAVQGSDQLDLVQPAGAQPHQSGHPTIGRLGAVLKKVTVQAKDDVYSNTKEKITQADQNEKRVRTKELKSNSSAKQRLLKRSLNSGHLSSGAAPPKRPATPLGGGHGSRPTPPHAAATTAGSRSLRDHVIHLLAVRPYNQAELLIRLRQNNLTVEAPALTRVLDEVGRLEPNRSRYILLPGLLAQV
uniref:ELL domain-containing protein n=4 Tax=Macrostomum lignano TaxID=282301 RepID=A0A1I8G8S3_9PLAT